MNLQGRKTASWLLAAALAVSGTGLVAKDKKKKETKSSSGIAQMDDRQKAVHALNRLTFGPRPGDVDRVAAMGVDKWIDQQLNPQKIDDGALEARLSQYRTLRMNNRELVENFPPPQVFRQIADGKMGMPRDPEKRAVYQSGMARYEARKDNKAAQQQDAQPNDDPSMMTDAEKQRRREARDSATQLSDQLLQLPPDQRMKRIIEMDPDGRRDFWRALPQPQRQQLVADLSPQQKETLLAMENPVQVVNGELMAAKVLRAAYSERQLDEVMTDFWFNHFNVFIGKGADRYMVTSYERDVIRPRALGRFEDLLLATAKSPAMLWYLDNWQSIGPRSDAATGRNRNQMGRRGRVRVGPFGEPILVGPQPPQPPQRGQAKQKQAPRGLNENYAREVMELHTLGVNGGYTQKDVTELARVLTGWTISEPRKGGGFEFDERRHEPGEKFVLGKKFKEHGEKEGEDALKMLAHHPSTAHFISTKLAMRFVSDDPPPALVDRMAETFLKSDGDIKAVLKTMFDSPEFWASTSYRAKVKTPFEFVVSSLRATGAQVQQPVALIQQLNKMGEPLYGAQPPTGYSMKAETWVNSSALLNRMNFALALGTGRVPGVQVDNTSSLGADPPPDAEGVQARLEAALLNSDISKQTHDTILNRLNDPQVTGRKLDDGPRPVQTGVIAGLILGSPEFQRR